LQPHVLLHERIEIDRNLVRGPADLDDLTVGPFGVNLILEWDQRRRLAICLDAGVRIISYFWSDLQPGSPYIEDAHASGARVMLTVGSHYKTFQALSGDFTAKYQWTPDLMTYLRIANSYGAGGFSGGPAKH